MNEQLTLHNQMLDALLLDYTTGSLSRPLELLVETHIAMNPSSARALQLMLKLGGVLLEDIEPVSMSEGALDKVMRQIEQDNDNQNAAVSERLDYILNGPINEGLLRVQLRLNTDIVRQ